MALSNELRDALAKRRQPRSMSADARKGVVERDIPASGAHRDYDQDIDGTDEPDRIPVTDDPNDIDDPDDRSTTVIKQSNDFDAPPPMPPCAWWIRMTLDPPDTPVNVEDARLCVSLVSAHLRQASQEVTGACLSSSEGGDGGRRASSDALRDPGDCAQMVDPGAPEMWNEKLDFPATVGQLHEAIESIGPNAWSVFVGLWQEACGIQEPAKNEKRQPKTTDAAELASKPDTPLPPLPADAPLLEEGLHRALLGMPERVAAFLLHTPKDPPPWRYRESEGERSAREGLESIGGWTEL